jgi:hypothetical protein
LVDALGLEGARDRCPERDAELVEDAPQVGLDRFLADEELGGDLAVRLPVSDKLRDLPFASALRAAAVSPCEMSDRVEPVWGLPSRSQMSRSVGVGVAIVRGSTYSQWIIRSRFDNVRRVRAHEAAAG